MNDWFTIRLAVAMCAMFGTLAAAAHNGATAIAYPMASITPDGNSSDWPAGIKRYPIALSAPESAQDFSGTFAVGYNLDEQSLFVLVEIKDDHHVVASDADLTFLSQDAHMLYLDLEHDPRGSGVSMYELSQNSIRKTLHASSWDAKTRENGLSGVSAGVSRDGDTTFYEWQIRLGSKLTPNRTIGLDHEVLDVDLNDRSRVSWGLFQYKSSLSNNLGDVFLVEKDSEPFGILEGMAELEPPYEETVPYGIEVTNVAHPEIWTQFPLLRNKNYKTELPSGTYKIRSALIGNVTANDVYLSAREDAGVTATIKSGDLTTAPLYKVKAAGEPELVKSSKGVLLAKGALDTRAVDEFFTQAMEFYAIPGLDMALIKNGKIAYMRRYGYSNAYMKENVSQNALFDSGSVTKPVFAVLVMKLVEEGVIDLDRPLYEYLPYKDIEHDKAYQQITARHVLTHRTGFPNWRRGQLNFVNEPGTFGYSGEGFVYLSKVVEKVTGSSVDALLDEYITEPLGMHSTYFSANDDLKARLVFGHNDKYTSSIRPAPTPNMAYSMHTNSRDFSIFMLSLLNQEILSADSYREMFSDQVAIPNNWSEANTDWRQAFGLGFQLKHSPYGFAFGHSGRNGGYDCSFEIYSDANVGYVFFTNSSNGFRMKNVVREFLISGRSP